MSVEFRDTPRRDVQAQLLGLHLVYLDGDMLISPTDTDGDIVTSFTPRSGGALSSPPSRWRVIT